MRERSAGQPVVRERVVPEYLREDLQTLKTYLGFPSLAEGLFCGNINRVLEVGAGVYPLWLDLDAMVQMSGLSHAARMPFFPRDEIRAIDPQMNTDEQLRGLFTEQVLTRFSREEATVEEVAGRVKKGEIAPFDLVFSKGLISTGYLAFGSNHPRTIAKRGSAILSAMACCLNPNNPDAVVMCSTRDNGMLVVSEDDLEKLGLTLEKGIVVTSATAKAWARRFREKGVFPKDAKGYKRIICRRKI